MKGAVHERYGAPGRVVEVRELEKPEAGSDEVLVRIRGASVNIADWYAVTGRPWIARGTTGLRGPKETRIGVDYSGVVEAVGADVTGFMVGDEVFGGRTGACGEYVVATADRAIVTKPATVTFARSAFATTYSPHAPVLPPNTSSPTMNPVTSAPTASTTPE